MAIIIKDTEIGNIDKDKNVVLVGGCFDILHPAHIEFLKRAKEKGDVLVVLLESDENVKKLKGENRPMHKQRERAENLSLIESVDVIVMLSFPDSPNYYYNLVNLLHPDIIAVTKGDPLLEVKKDQANMVGGKVAEVMERIEKHSSTRIINKEENKN